MALTEKLTGIADAIRGKTGGTDPLTLDRMATEIAGIETGGGGIGAVKCVDVDITVEASTTTETIYTVADQAFKSAIASQTKWQVFNGGELYLCKITPKEYKGEATGNTTRVFKDAISIITGHTNYVQKKCNLHSFGASGSLQTSDYGIYLKGSIGATSATAGVAKFNLSVAVRHESTGNYEVRPGTYNIQIWYVTDFAWEIG